MKKSIWSVFIAFLFLIVLINGCVPAPTISSAPPTSTLSPILPTATFTPIPITPTPYDKLASSDDKLRLDFFRKGGIWSFRISETETETEWIIVILAQKSALDNKQEIQLGSTVISSPDGFEGAKKVLDLYNVDTETWNDFARLFADGIEQGEFDAFLVKTAPITGSNNVPLSVSVTLTKDSFLEVVIK